MATKHPTAKTVATLKHDEVTRKNIPKAEYPVAICDRIQRRRSELSTNCDEFAGGRMFKITIRDLKFPRGWRELSYAFGPE